MTSVQPEQMIGRTAIDSDGDKIGKIGQVYLDEQTEQPVWITVSTGLFGNKQSFAPLAGAQFDGDDVRLAVTKDQVKDAPDIDDDGHTNPDEEEALYSHYSSVLGQHQAPARSNHDYGDGHDRTTPPAVDSDPHTASDAERPTSRERGGPGSDTSGPNTDEAMTRSEERLDVGTQTVETGRARLRKYVVTENVTQTVPVSHEEVRIEREPITDANAGDATDGPAISEEEHEVTLHAERPVVQKETVPVERVRMDTETITGEEQVDGTVRKEQIDIDDDRSG